MQLCYHYHFFIFLFEIYVVSKLPDDFLNYAQSQLSACEYQSFLAHCQRPLRKSIRVNTLKISVEKCCALLKKLGWILTPIPWCETGFWFQRPENDATALGNLPPHLMGLFYIQEASSMLPASALFFGDKQPAIVLDAAAAPGSKTTQMATSMQNQGLIIANEFSASRLKSLFSNVQRCGMTCVALTHADASIFGQILPEHFDAILLDAPCSGEGTLRKDPDAMKNWSIHHVHQIANLQKKLIDSVFQALKPGGSLVYSTCTLNTFENQEVCYWLKEKYPHVVEFTDLSDLFVDSHRCKTPEGFLHIWPHIFDTEGFFVAKIKKKMSIFDQKTTKNKLGTFPFIPLTAKQRNSILDDMKQHFGENLKITGDFYQRDQEVWCFPPEIKSFIGKVKFNRIGYQIATVHKGKPRKLSMHHDWVIAQGHQASKNIFNCNHEQAKRYLKGEDIYPDTFLLSELSGEIIMRYQGHVLGLGKIVANRIKNKLPRELIRS